MTSFESYIRPRLSDYIEKLQEKRQYEGIDINLSFLEGQDEGIVIASNAGMWLCHSYMLTEELSIFIKQEYDVFAEKQPLCVDIKFCKKRETKVNAGPKKPNVEKNNTPSNNLEQAIFVTEKPKYKLEDVILPEDTKRSINDAISTIDNFDIVYNQWNFKSKEPSAKTNICFFGAPGTGKTMCAHAIADKLGKDILVASYADIQSQYVGVGPKNLKALFHKAEEENAVLFFDEADSFLRKRTSDNSSSASMHYNSMTNEMMKHLEDFNGVVIFATNLTDNTDDAFKTRLSFSIEFKEPDESCRLEIIKKMIPLQVPLEKEFDNEDYLEMAKVCEGFVGRDIRNSVKTILSVGAQNKQYPFTKKQFIDGFISYKENKESFDKSSKSKKNQSSNPMDIYTANGCIHNLLTYSAWVDGKENDTEVEYLKTFSRVLGRSKLIINSISDLPELEEICHEITDDVLKKKTIVYYTYFMAITKQNDSLYYDLRNQICKFLNYSDTSLDQVEEYYQQVKTLSSIKDKI